MDRERRLYSLPEGWMHNAQVAEYLGKTYSTIYKVVNNLEDQYPQDFRLYPHRGRPTIFYSPRLINHLAERYNIEKRLEVPDLEAPKFNPRNKGVKEALIKIARNYQPGQTLVLSELARELNVSREGVRQAYEKLKKTGEYTLPPLKLGYRHEGPEFGDRVRKHLSEGRKSKEISEILNCTQEEVNQVVSQLYQETLSEVQRVRTEIKRLRNEQKLGDREIAKILNQPIRRVNNHLDKLIESGEAIRLRKKRSTPKEAEDFKARVKILRDQGLIQSRIAKELNASEYKVTWAVNSLLREGRVQKLSKEKLQEIVRQRERSTKLERGQFLTKVKELKDQGLKSSEIAEKLNKTLSQVNYAISVLKKEGRIVDKFLERRLKIKELRLAGLGNLEIARKLNESYYAVTVCASKLIKEGEIPPIQKGRPRKKV